MVFEVTYGKSNSKDVDSEDPSSEIKNISVGLMTSTIDLTNHNKKLKISRLVPINTYNLEEVLL